MHSPFPHQRPPSETYICHNQLAYTDMSYQPELIVYIRVHSWRCTVCEVCQMRNDRRPPLWFHTAAWKSLVLCLFIPPLHDPHQPGIFSLSLESKRVITRLWNWLLSLGHTRVRCPASFRGLTARFFPALTTTPSSRWTTVRSSTHCWGTSYCFEILTIMNESCKRPCVRIYGDISYQQTKIMASGPITSWEIDGETVETVSDFIFGGFKITADGDCSHEIKRHLLLGRKVMTNLDSILKTRDITLPTKVHLVKAVVFPVVMCGCESWTIKKAECWRTDAFELWYWRRLLRVPWTSRRFN